MKLSSDLLDQLRASFLEEVRAKYPSALEALSVLRDDPENTEALQLLVGMFHTIRGTCPSLGFPTLGRVATMCELAGHLPAAGKDRTASTVVQILSEGVDIVASIIEAADRGPSVAPATETAQTEQAQAETDDDLGHSAGDFRIMVIDDDPVSAELIASTLEQVGFHADRCTEPLKAIDLLKGDVPDLIILDVMMPTVDGFELCRQLRMIPSLRLTPVIFLTARTDVEQRVRGLEVGGNDYVLKPFNGPELVARVRSHLQRLSALQELAIRDGLTHCYNHRHFKSRLVQEMNRSRRYKRPLSLALLDLDHFKSVNDTHGHTAGDEILARVARELDASVRSSDMVARYGGEEFAVLFVEATNGEAQVIVNRFRERVAGQKFSVPSKTVDDDNIDLGVTVSVGVAQLTDGEDPMDFIARADAALYDAKENGRNQVCVAGAVQ